MAAIFGLLGFVLFIGAVLGLYSRIESLVGEVSGMRKALEERPVTPPLPPKPPFTWPPGTFGWAIERMQEGRMVRRSGDWPGSTVLPDGKDLTEGIRTAAGMVAHENLLYATDWELVPFDTPIDLLEQGLRSGR